MILKRIICLFLLFLFVVLLTSAWECSGFVVKAGARLKNFDLHLTNKPEIEQRKEQQNINNQIVHGGLSRRHAVGAAVTTGLLLSSCGAAIAKSSNDGLGDIFIGEGKWTKSNLAKHNTSPIIDSIVPATFATYSARFLVNYDEGARLWWQGLLKKFSLLSQEEKSAKLGRSFGGFSRSVQIGLDDYLSRSVGVKQGYTNLLQIFLDKYGTTVETKRQIGLLFATLPSSCQPTELMSSTIVQRTLKSSSLEKGGGIEIANNFLVDEESSPPKFFDQDITSLLSGEFQCRYASKTKTYVINPLISLYEIGVDEEFGQTATLTFAGPIAALPLKREQPDFPFDVYALLGISGAAGCAITHSLVIPLDVVKTRIQTDPEMASGSLLESASNIVKAEGPAGLVLGAQATIAGYLWYGVSVYPSYTFFKRLITQSLLSPEVAVVHMNDIALFAGALAAVIASFGLTPLEAARIRTVAEPKIYRQKGLLGTLEAISTEDEELGWKKLYAGFASLLTRQVIFGSVKFLAFEQACEAIFKMWPVLQDATWTSLLVSLVGGGLSGTLSSVVSQPADSVLTYVAQSSGSRSLGVFEGAILMVEEGGLKSLYRGVGSRCLWAGSIIAGQFLLYDVFRTLLSVNKDDLSQFFEVVISGGQTIN